MYETATTIEIVLDLAGVGEDDFEVQFVLRHALTPSVTDVQRAA
jgi:HSP20 family molecular chaperone IbpA